jgi:quinolinate synthase
MSAATHSPAAFPSLLIRADALVPKGPFAEAQAEFLSPDVGTVRRLGELLAAKNAGVVAHFYMDAELQGVLSACDSPHIHISDSLKMADAAVAMADAGVGTIVVLGVDFMSENVRAVLDHQGHRGTRVYRVAADPIGCSLAESAEAAQYGAWLTRAKASTHPLHVIYINTSLETKARSHDAVPTITCTSSNVVQTLLQAAAQLPDGHIWYGPDTYMGRNLAAMLGRFKELPEDEIRALHPAHDKATVGALLDRFHHYEQGVCVVHHMFGEQVVEQLMRDHSDAFHTAHLEVPGEMFRLAVEAQRRGRGVVGSTSDILGFIAGKVAEAAARPGPARLQVVLGTEAGMITAIVKRVRELLVTHARDDIEVEIIFPVASEAVTAEPGSELGLVPGVSGAEGCSVAGGCATCPYMKMNDLDALLEVLARVGTDAEEGLADHRPRQLTTSIGGRSAAEVGGEPILHMRHFQATGRLPDALVDAVVTQTAA